MYNLTDFSEQELRDMSEALNLLIEEKKGLIEQSQSHGEDLANFCHDSNRVKSKSIARLREMNVRTLTALQIVKDRKLIASN